MKLDPEDEYLRGSLYIMTTSNGHAYAYLSEGMAIHRKLASVKGLDVDHLNGDTLDNRKINLRAVTRNENNRNSDVVWGSSKCRGVSHDKRRDKWVAYIKHYGQTIFLGRHATEGAANRARLTKEQELWGINPRRAKEFAKIAA